MEFITILICLAVERWTNFGAYIRKFSLLERYIKLFVRLKMPSHLGLVIILLPLVLVVGVIYWALLHVWFGLYAFIFSVAILLYCLGEFEINKKRAALDERYQNPNEQEIVTLLSAANHNIFAILFWFIVLGPLGSVLYRLNDLLSHQNDLPEYAIAAKQFENVLDWIPVRLFVFSFALISHFLDVFKIWMQHGVTGINFNEEFMAKCGFAAVKDEKNISNLIDRALIVWLVVFAVVILL